LLEDYDGDVYLFRKAFEIADLEFELVFMLDGAEALAFVRGEGKYSASSAPDLVVLDLTLPVSTAARKHGGRIESTAGVPRQAVK
jgi:CheY-like chemotaxis protein